jgi:hypothetical protein
LKISEPGLSALPQLGFKIRRDPKRNLRHLRNLSADISGSDSDSDETNSMSKFFIPAEKESGKLRRFREMMLSRRASGHKVAQDAQDAQDAQITAGFSRQEIARHDTGVGCVSEHERSAIYIDRSVNDGS